MSSIKKKKKIVRIGQDRKFVSLVFPSINIPVKVCYDYYKKLINSDQYEVVEGWIA